MKMLPKIFENIREKMPVTNPQGFIDDLVAMQDEFVTQDDAYKSNLAEGTLGADDHLKMLSAAIEPYNIPPLTAQEVWTLQAFFMGLIKAYTPSAFKHQDDIQNLHAQSSEGEAHDDVLNEAQASLISEHADNTRRLASAMSMVSALTNLSSESVAKLDTEWDKGLKKQFHITDEVTSQVKSLYKALGLDPADHIGDIREVSWLFMYGPSIGQSSSSLSVATVTALTVAGLFATGCAVVLPEIVQSLNETHSGMG